ncbi:TetR/AcrR family transcriptional regulator [Amycolatopsis sp. NPDC047767]|uniref:TetR/AcrR family transcriptional regulator n=1 Tax=Amycolatopsis sp. NPDC047767 TaxID=3156765 RepID=UPI0034573B24
MTPRADARDNRAQLVRAAREVFAAEGSDAPLDRVAKRAGIGNATLYRHFPRRRDLLATAYAEEVETLRAQGEALLAHEDPEAALFTWLGLFLDHVRDKRDLALSITDDPGGDREELFARWHRVMTDTATALATRAGLAEEVEPLDLLVLTTGIALSGAEKPRVERLLRVIRRGSTGPGQAGAGQARTG